MDSTADYDLWHGGASDWIPQLGRAVGHVGGALGCAPCLHISTDWTP